MWLKFELNCFLETAFGDTSPVRPEIILDRTPQSPVKPIDPERALCLSQSAQSHRVFWPKSLRGEFWSNVHGLSLARIRTLTTAVPAPSGTKAWKNHQL